MTCPICDNKPANCDCSDVELEMHERITSQAARIKALEAESVCSVCSDGRPNPNPAQVCFKHSTCNAADFATLQSVAAERDALRAEVEALQGVGQIERGVTESFRRENTRLRAALDEACRWIEGDRNPPLVVARIRAIAAGK